MANAGFASRFSSIRYKTVAMMSDSFSVRASAGGAKADRISTRQAAGHLLASRFDSVKLAVVVVSGNRYDVRAGQTGRAGDRFSARSGARLSKSDRFSVRFPTAGGAISRFTARSLAGAVNRIRHNAYVLPGWNLVARNAETDELVSLGFIAADADPMTLEDVTLADGVWEIEARPAEWFWDSCRGRKVVTLIAGEEDEEEEPLQGLPAIQNLHREIISFQSVIKWKVGTEYEPQSFKFGLWFSPTSPVDTSGDPDVETSYFSGIGDYEYTHAQAAAEYVAVAAFTDEAVGLVAEIELPWEAVAPTSPTNQFATNGG